MATVSASQRQLIHTSNTYESNGDVTVGGNLQVNGTTMTVDTANLLVEDHNIVIGNVASPTDTTADGGGITLKGATDKTINWINSTDAWTFSDKISVPSLYLTSNPSLSSESTALVINASNQVGYRELGSNAFNSTAFLTGNQTITLSGDVSGSGTTSINVTVADDSHNHVISNVDGLQTALNAKLNLSGGTLTGDLVVEDSEIHVGDKSNDQWTRILHASANGYGFSWQHTNATVLVNEQGSTNQVMVLGDVDASDYSGLFGIAHSANGGTSWTKKLDLRGNGDLYIGSSGTSKVFHDGYHPNADTLTTARTISLAGDVTGSVSFNGSANVSISTAVANNSHYHTIENVTNLQSSLNAKAPLASPAFSGNPTAPTPATSDNDTSIATTAFVKAQGYVTTDTNTTYSAGTHLSLSGTTFNVDFATADKVVNIGHNSTNNEGEIILDTSYFGSPQISFTDHGDASWAIGIDDDDNSFKIHGSASSTIPRIGGVGTPLFEVTTGGLGYLGTNRLFADNYHPNADTLTTARTISLSGAVTGSASFNGGSDITIATTATADPTLTLAGDASGSATFTNLGNATLTVTVADDSHNHVISNVDGLQTALDGKAASSHDHTGLLKRSDIGSGADLNSYTTDGYYHQNSNSNTTSGSNYPVSQAGMLTVQSDGAMVYQKYQVYSNHTIYHRTYYNGTWYAWQRAFNDAYHPNADTLTTARTISLGGDLSGSASFNGSSNITITAAVADDSHNHIISNVDGLQTALDGKAASSHTHTFASLTSKPTTLSGYGITDAASSSHSHSNATTSVAGFMSNTDKSKLDGIASGANNYSLPEATATSRGGIELFSNTDQAVSANSVSSTAGRTYGIQLNSAGQAVVNVPWSDTNTTYSVGNGGLTEINFTSALNTKLAGIETGATGVQTAAEIRTLVESATDSNVFTDADHTKLNGIATNANNYSLPAATSTTRGGIELYSNTLGGSAQSVTSTSNRFYGLQVDSSGRAMVNVPWTNVNSSYLTQDDYEDIHWKQTGRIFTPQCTPLFYNSSGTAGTLAAVCFSRTETTSTANAWAQANLYRGITNEVSWSGGGIEYSRKLGVSFRCAFLASGTQAQSIRYMVGGRANSVQAAGSNPLVNRGFGVEIRSRTGTTLEWRVMAHNGTSFSASSWSDIPSNATSVYTKELYIYSDGAGNIEAGIDDRGGDGSTWTTKTTTGGPTGNGNSTYPYITHEVVNAASGSSYARARVYDYKIFSE